MKRFYLIFFCFFAWQIQAEKTSICLNMIVKDESHVIERALSSIKPLINHWVIVDTGSSDNTPDLIRETLKDIPGELYQRPWKDYGSNRSEALQFARGKSDYILFLDADDWLDYQSPHVLSQLEADMIWARWQSRHVPSFTYMKQLLIKDSLSCHWEGVKHEGLVCDSIPSHAVLTDITYIFTSEGNTSKNPKKYEDAAKLLEDALRNEPDNSRYAFYLAESYRDANCPREALGAYEKRVTMGGWAEEIFWSLLQIGHLKKTLGYPYEEIIASYLRAQAQNPFRSEPVYFLAELYNKNGNYNLAYQCIKEWERLPQSDQSNLLFQLAWTKEYGISFQLAVAAFYIHEYRESLDLHDQLLKNKQLPESWQTQVSFNREFPLRYLEDEIFSSLLEIAHLKKRLGYPLEQVVSSYSQAHIHNPNRSEPIYYLADLYNQTENYSLAYECIKKWQGTPKPFRQGWIEDYGIPFQLSIASFYVHEYRECLHLNDQLLRNSRLPESWRNQVLINRGFPLHLLMEE